MRAYVKFHCIVVYDHCSLDNLKTSAEYEYEGEYGEKFSYL